jgi:hypothetical protein
VHFTNAEVDYPPTPLDGRNVLRPPQVTLEDFLDLMGDKKSVKIV